MRIYYLEAPLSDEDVFFVQEELMHAVVGLFITVPLALVLFVVGAMLRGRTSA
jgi:hypothetical protein